MSDAATLSDPEIPPPPSFLPPLPPSLQDLQAPARIADTTVGYLAPGPTAEHMQVSQFPSVLFIPPVTSGINRLYSAYLMTALDLKSFHKYPGVQCFEVPLTFSRLALPFVVWWFQQQILKGR